MPPASQPPFEWWVRFPWSDELVPAIERATSGALAVERLPLNEGAVKASGGRLGHLPAVRAALRAAAAPFREECVYLDEPAERLADASLVQVSAPKPRGITMGVRGEPALRQRRCETCGVEGFVTVEREAMAVRLHDKPVDGLILLADERGGASAPRPWLSYAMSDELRAGLADAGLLADVAFVELEIERRPAARYSLVVPRERLGPRAAPYGLNERQRNCSICGYRGPRFAIYPVFARPERGADWWLAPPWGATDIYVSPRVFAWMAGPGKALVAARAGNRLRGARAGWWPDERELAFLPSAARGE
ncbi:MAG TPA: hypothetical protein VFS00_34040 [Polyangiaceae bacterium]|nr:hypothetical protein [Polyangiaceae bacterium]